MARNSWEPNCINLAFGPKFIFQILYFCFFFLQLSRYLRFGRDSIDNSRIRSCAVMTEVLDIPLDQIQQRVVLCGWEAFMVACGPEARQEGCKGVPGILEPRAGCGHIQAAGLERAPERGQGHGQLFV